MAERTAPGSGSGDPEISSGSLPFSYDLYSFRGYGGATTVIAAFAVPANELKRDRVDGDVRYRFDISFVLADTARHTVFRSDDSVYVAVPFPLPGDHLLYTHVEVHAEPSTATVHRVVMTDANDPGVGQLYGSGFPIRDYRGDRLMISDVALSQPDVGGGWRRGDVTLALLPTDLLPASDFDLYYEVYNLSGQMPYETEISIEPVDEDGNPEEREGGTVRTAFSGQSETHPDGSVRELRHISASLKEGRYRITVAVTDRTSGRTATRSRMFHVRGPGEGATVVPALSSSGR